MTKRKKLVDATMKKEAPIDPNDSIHALGIIIRAAGLVAESYGLSKNIASHITKIAVTEPLSAFIEATEALQPAFGRGFTLGLEGAYDTIRRVPLENQTLSLGERQLLFDTVFKIPSLEKTEALLAKLK